MTQRKKRQRDQDAALARKLARSIEKLTDSVIAFHDSIMVATQETKPRSKNHVIT